MPKKLDEVILATKKCIADRCTVCPYEDKIYKMRCNREAFLYDTLYYLEELQETKKGKSNEKETNS